VPEEWRKRHQEPQVVQESGLVQSWAEEVASALPAHDRVSINSKECRKLKENIIKLQPLTHFPVENRVTPPISLNTPTRISSPLKFPRRKTPSLTGEREAAEAEGD